MSARATVLWSVGAGLAAFALYLALAPAGVGDGDAGEFTLVLAVGGVPHPPGYPLYTLLGHVWAVLLHAAGVDWARAASAWSALGGAVAVALLVATGMRIAGEGARLPAPARAAAALAAAAPFALSPAWLREVTVAEVNSWHLALLAALCLATLAMLRPLAGAASAGAIARVALLWGLLSGAALSHRATAAFFVLPLGIALLASLPREARALSATWLRFAAGLALPFLAYAFIAWRATHPARHQWPLLEPSLGGLLAHMRAEVFTFYMGGFAPRPDQQALLHGAVWPVLVPGGALLVWVLLRAAAPHVRAFAGALFAAAAIQTGFALQYGVPDPLAYFLPALLVVSIAAAERLGRLARHAPGPAALAPAAAFTALLAFAWLPTALAHRRALEAADRAIRARWESIPFERGIVLWTGDYYVRLRAYQILEGSKPDLYVESPAMLTWDPPRRDFQRRFGFDPLAGLALETDADLPRILPNIARQTDLPVIDFERARP